MINERLTEIIQDDRLKGFKKSIIHNNRYETDRAKIHYSKTGIHLVPTLKDVQK
ncbi:MAG: polymorphic toxin type 50 domain-containing protein [Treponema sp.]